MSRDPVRLVNLTSHSVQIDREDGGVISLPAADAIHAARLPQTISSSRSVRTEHGSISAVVVTQGGRPEGLPKKQKGTLYVVSRLTAFNSRRRDLVFPMEKRGENGFIIGAVSIAFATRNRFAQPLFLARIISSVKSWKWWTNPSRSEIAISFALLTAIGSVTVGIAADESVNGFGARASGVLLGFSCLTAAIGVFSYKLWRNAENARSLRGTAYFVEELGSNWTTAETDEFRAIVENSFKSLLEVPGPATAENWNWPLDDMKAAEWSSRFESLVRGFAAVRHNDDQLTSNGIFVTAHWPVALALGARLPRLRRGMLLSVYQRPSNSSRGPMIAAITRKAKVGPPTLVRPHTFIADAQAPNVVPGVEFRVDKATASVVILGDEVAGRVGDSPVTAGSVVVLVRLLSNPWGPVVSSSETRASAPVLKIRNSTGMPISAGQADLYDVHLVDARGSRLPPGEVIKWDWYPAIAARIVDWIKAQKFETPVLLGMMVPQEIGVGVGIVGLSRDATNWPEHLLPMIHVRSSVGDGHFVVPNLDIGTILLDRA